MILQHPQEQDRALGTARLTALHFQDAVLKIGLSWPSLSKALGRPVHDPSRWAVLYLGSAKVDDSRHRPRHRRDQPQRRDGGRSTRDPRGHRGHRAAGWYLEPGQGAVVAQRVDAEVPARYSRTPSGLALWQASQGAASGRTSHDRGRGDDACQPGRSSGHRGNVARELSSGCWQNIGRCRRRCPNLRPDQNRVGIIGAASAPDRPFRRARTASNFRTSLRQAGAGCLSRRMLYIDPDSRGHVAEWLRNGLQNRVLRFNSGRGLHQYNQMLRLII